MARTSLSFRFTDRSDRIMRELTARYQSGALQIVFEAMDREAAKTAGNISKFSRTVLDWRTGILGRSIVGRAVEHRGLPALRVGIFRGPAVAYAAAQEFGTKGEDASSPIPTIRPRQARALAVPVGPDTKTPAGVARFSSPREQGDLDFVPFRRTTDHGIVVGGLFTRDAIERARQRGSFQGIRASWLLMAQLDLEPREYLLKGMLQELEEVGERILDALEAYMALDDLAGGAQ